MPNPNPPDRIAEIRARHETYQSPTSIEHKAAAAYQIQAAAVDDIGKLLSRIAELEAQLAKGVEHVRAVLESLHVAHGPVGATCPVCAPRDAAQAWADSLTTERDDAQ